MKAAVCRAFGAPLSIEEVSLAAPGAGEVRVRIKACAICHSDITFIDGGWGGALPAVYGHEAAGEVLEVGEGVTDFAAGDPVVATLIRSCGRCPSCASGAPTACQAQFPLDERSPISDGAGAALTHGLRTGAFAEEAVVEASQLVRIPEDMPYDSASLLACGVITGLGAVLNTAAMRPGADVAVVGLGGVGINALQGAAIGGARRIIGLDLSEGKRALAIGFGATHAVDPAAPNALERVMALTEGAGVDYVFVCVGAKRAIESAQAMLAPGGAIVVVGMPASGVMTEYDPVTLAAAGQRILGSKMGSARIRVDIPYLVTLYQQDRLKLDELITGRYPLERINDAIDEVKRGEALRNVIQFD